VWRLVRPGPGRGQARPDLEEKDVETRLSDLIEMMVAKRAGIELDTRRLEVDTRQENTLTGRYMPLG